MAEEGRSLVIELQNSKNVPIFTTFQENPLVFPVLMTSLLLQIKSVGRSREQEQGRAGWGCRSWQPPQTKWRAQGCYSGTSSTTWCQNLSDEASSLLILSVTPLTFSSLPSVGKTWFNPAKNGRACFKGGKQVPSPVAATAQKASGMWQQGQRAQLLSACAGKGEEEGTEKAKVLEGRARDAVMEGLAFGKESGLTSRMISA